MDFVPYITQFKRRFEEAEGALNDPSIFKNPAKARDLAREHARLRRLAGIGEDYLKDLSDRKENQEMLSMEAEDSEMAEMAREEIQRLNQEILDLEKELRLGIIPPEPTDSRNTIIEIRAGAGGAESALFSADLYRMYCRFAETKGWKVETMDSSPSDLGGFKEIIFAVNGDDVYKLLKFESGVHRVQRVPATEAQGRVHTSTVTVAVLPEAEEVDLEIKPDELDISVCRASGPGGQGVNTTDSAVQIIHKPTGMIVRCADQRSQIKNRAQAMTVLRSRLLEAKVAEENAKYAAERKSQVGTGERNERIRTYNFTQNRVTDHRIELTLYNLPSFLEGDIDEVVDALLQDYVDRRLEASKQSTPGDFWSDLIWSDLAIIN